MSLGTGVEQRLGELVRAIVRADSENTTDFSTQVSIGGPIGAGKSKTIALLCAQLEAHGFDVHVIKEERPPELFELYLKDPATYGDDFQHYMAHRRASNAVGAKYIGIFAQNGTRRRPIVLHERTILEDAGFFEVNVQMGRIPAARRAAYERMTSDARERCLRDVHLFVMLDVPLETTRTRMFARGRAGEFTDATEREAYGEDPYFEKLYEWYTAFGDEMEALAPGRVHTYDNSEHSPLHLSAASID